ncbi:unnamed protein product [Brachionus calyciflorus]|uniref:Integrase catalytic domain-containing protein n=1 Tax=Brachionus calyciflorus TaxID=104777 RepID=A0A814LN94_9BILA|nr:unnamed protein product [Brachionus calyciflorus]
MEIENIDTPADQINDERKELHREIFEKYLKDCKKDSTSLVIDREKYHRFQIDQSQIRLIKDFDKGCEHNGKNYKWIAHVIDHFSKFHILWAQEHKSAEEVVQGTEERVFVCTGLPYCKQSDNGTEFRNHLMKNLIDSWDGDCKVVHGRPRHPQSQGLVEQSNRTLERMMSAMMTQFNTDNWVKLLPKIMYNLNTPESSLKENEEYEIDISNDNSVEPVSEKLNHLGDKVSVRIPREDRGGTDLPRLSDLIKRISKDFYEIVTQYGKIDVCFRACDLELYYGPLDIEIEKVSNKIALRTAAKKMNERNDDIRDIEITCECVGKCSDKRCRCLKAGQTCNSHCHVKLVSKSCKNK